MIVLLDSFFYFADEFISLMTIIEKVENRPKSMINICYSFAKGLNENDFDFLLGELSPEVKSKLVGLRQKNDRLLLLISMALLLKILKETRSGYGLKDIKYTPEGRPFFQNATFDFNYSHTKNCVVMAWSETCRIGVDAETIRPVDTEQYVNVFSPQTRKDIQNSNHPHISFFRYWTQLESALKADGRGLPLVSSTQIHLHSNKVLIDDQIWYTQAIHLASNLACCLASNHEEKVKTYHIIGLC